MTKERSAKIINVITIEAWGLVLGRGYILVIIMNILYLLLYQYTSEWLLLYLGNVMLPSYVTVDFYLFYDGAADMQIWDKTLHKILV